MLSFSFYSSFRIIFMMALNDLTGPSAGPLARIPYFIHSFINYVYDQYSEFRPLSDPP